MKIRKSISAIAERKVYLHENKKEETVLVSIPSINWSYLFTYEESGEILVGQMEKTLNDRTTEEEAAELARRILNWSREM